MSKSYYHPCPDCGANLDPGEVCDCVRSAIKETEDVSDDDHEHIQKLLRLQLDLSYPDRGVNQLRKDIFDLVDALIRRELIRIKIKQKLAEKT